MQIDYATSMAFREGLHAFAAEEQQEEAVEGDENPFLTGQYKDLWQRDGDRLIRHHNIPRRKFFTPPPQFPDNICLDDILDGRVTEMRFLDSQQHQRQEGPWWKQQVSETEFWTGRSMFRLKPREESPTASCW